MLCHHYKGCKRDATCVPEVVIPPKHMPEELIAPVRVTIPLPMCNRCIQECKPGDFMNDDIKRQVESANAGKHPIDYGKPRLERRKMSESQMKNLLTVAPGGLYGRA